MRVSVDLLYCQGNGMCVIAAPEVFTLRPEGKVECAEIVDDARREEVERACDACPTQAISIVE